MPNFLENMMHQFGIHQYGTMMNHRSPPRSPKTPNKKNTRTKKNSKSKK